MSLVVKYRPTQLKEILGNKDTISQIEKWFKSGVSSMQQQNLIIYGPCGIGKSLTIDILIEKYNFYPTYYDACDICKKTLDDIQLISNNFFVSNRLLIIDNVDKLTGVSMIEIRRVCKVPIVFIGNKISSKISQKRYLKLEFKKILKKSILAFVNGIVKTEGIKIKKCDISNVIKYNSDIRSILIALTNVGCQTKDTSMDSFSLLKIVCETPMNYNEIEELVGYESYYTGLLLNQNYLNYKLDMSEISEIADTFSYQDVLLSKCELDFSIGNNTYLSECVANKCITRGSHPKQKCYTYAYPYLNTLPSRQRSKKALRENLSSKGLTKDHTDFLQFILNKNNSKKLSSNYNISLDAIKNLKIDRV
jgi:hypothetical protein